MANAYVNRKDDRGRVLRHGEFQRKDGRYVFKYKDLDGKTKAIYARRLDKSDRVPAGMKKTPSLREQEDEILRNLHDGIFGSCSDLTVFELAKRYTETKLGVKESTKTGYKTVLRFLESDPFGKRRVDSIKLSDAKLWLINLQKNGKSYSTIHNIRGVLRPAFRMALEDDLIRRNPFDFELGSVIINDSKKRDALTPEQEEAFLSFIKDDKHYSVYYDVIYILLNTGLRVSEFCGLIPEDIDFKNECIHVNGQLVRHSNMLTSYEVTKTAAGIRKIPMTKEVMECFRRLEAVKRPEYEIEIDGRKGFLCLDKNGNPMVALHWEHYFNHIVKKYNEHFKVPIPNVTPHVCRHTFCSKMARKGIHIKSLQYIMGHSEIGVTLDTYTHLSFEDAAKDFRKVISSSNEDGDMQ